MRVFRVFVGVQNVKIFSVYVKDLLSIFCKRWMYKYFIENYLFE